MAIEQVQSFKTGDGQLFDSYAAAAKHDAEVALAKFVEEQSYSGIRSDGIVEMLTANAELVIAMLQRIVNPAQLGIPEPGLSALLRQIRRDGISTEATAHLARIGAAYQGDHVLRIPLDVPELMNITQVRTGEVLNHVLAVYPVTVNGAGIEPRLVCIIEAYHPVTRALQPFGQLEEHSADVQRIVREVLLSMAN